MNKDKENEKIPAQNAPQNDAGRPILSVSGSANARSQGLSQHIEQTGELNKVVETYAEDMARVIENDQGGLIKKIIQEQTEKEKQKKNLSPESRKNKFFILAGTVLLLFTLFAFIFLFLREDAYTVSIEKQFTPIIFNDKSFFIEIVDLPKDKIIASILTEIRETKLKDGGLEGIYLTKNKQIIGLRNFINVMKSSLILPSKTLVSDNFLFGIVNGETKDFFILIKVRSFTDIFDSVKIWENKMLYDLRAFFEIPINANTSYLFTKDFEDGIIENKNARILYDKDREIVLMYVFADDTSFVIANKTDAVREVMFRLSSSKVKK